MPGAIHEAAVETIRAQFPQARTTGFMKEVARLLVNGEQEPCRVRIIPDAFIVDEPNRVLVAYEVEDQSRVSNRKMERYATIWWTLDSIGWSIGLIVVDRWGNGVAAVDVGEFAFRASIREARRHSRRPGRGWKRFVNDVREQRRLLTAAR